MREFPRHGGMRGSRVVKQEGHSICISLTTFMRFKRKPE